MIRTGRHPRRFEVAVWERNIGKRRRKLSLARLQPRPFHPKKDAAEREIFFKTSLPWQRMSCRRTSGASPLKSGLVMKLAWVETAPAPMLGHQLALARLILDGADWHQTGGTQRVSDSIAQL